MAEKTIKFNDILNKGISEFINPKPKTIKVEDNRKVSPTTGKPIPPSDNIIDGNKELIQAIIAHAKANNINPQTALSVAYQETKLGKSDTNIGHNLLKPSQQWLDNDESGLYNKQVDRDASMLIDGIKQKFDYANSLGKTNLVDSLQVYNGLGKLSPSTESKYYKGVQQNSFYGVPVTKDNPIDLSKNPLYGKAVKSIQDSVIGINPDIQSLIKNTKPFEMKKYKLGGKIRIPKYAPGGYMTTGDTVQLADSNMLQGYDSGLSSIPDYSQQKTGMSTDAKVGMAGGIMGGIGSAMPSQVELTAEQQGLEKGKDQLAQSNPFIGFFRGIEKMANGIGGAIGGKKGEETMRSVTDPFQAGLGHIHDKNLTAGQKALQFLPFGNLALPEMDKRFDKQFETKNAGSNLNFGNVIEMALGGLVTNTSSKDFKQFDAKPHIDGGQFIDKNKNPTNDQNKAVAEIEKKENSYKDYIFSDTLLHKNEITFAKQADKINRKYKDREDVISKNSLDIELTELMKKNEKQRQLAEEQNQQLLANVMMFGGDIKEFKNGGKVEPIYTDNPNDKGLKAYNDSLSLYKLGEKNFNEKLNYSRGEKFITSSNKNIQGLTKHLGKIMPKEILTKEIQEPYATTTFGRYNKPVQPVIYKKETGVPIPKTKFAFPDEQVEQSNIVDENYKVPEQGQGYPLPDYLTQTVKTPNGMKTYKRKDTNSGWQEQYALGGFMNKRKSINAFDDMVDNSFYSPDGKFFTSQDQYQKFQDLNYPQENIPNLNPIINNYGKIKFKKNNFQFKNGGKVVDPIYTDNPKDKRLQAYNDSLSLYKLGIEGNKLLNNPSTTEDIWKKYVNQFYNTDGTINKNNKYNQAGTRLTKLNGKPVVPEKISNERNFGNGYTGDMQMYKKPVQPVIYQKPEVKVPVPKKKFAFPDEQEDNIVDESYKVPEQTQGYPLPDYLTQTVKTPNGMKTYKRKDDKSAWVEQYKNGGIIKKYGNGGLDPSDPDYFTKLMQQQGIMNFDNIGPIEDRSMLGPLNKSKFSTTTNDNSEAKSDYEFYKSGQVGTPIVKGANGKNGPSALEIAGYGIKGAELLGHAIQAFKKPELVNPVYNPEENTIKALMRNRKIDMQSVLDALDLKDTANRQAISDNSTSVGVMQANLQKANANQVSAIAKTKLDEQLQNNQYRGDEANVLNNLGQQKTQAQVYAEDVNARSKANVQNQRDKFLKESIGGLGDFLLKKDYVNKDNEFQMNILKSKGVNFEPTDYKTWNKAGIDIVKFDAELESTTDTEKRKELIETTKQKFLKEGGTEEAWNRNIYALQNKQLKK